MARNGRPPCHYCGQCGRGCMTASNYASSYVQIFPAMKTGTRAGHRQRDGARADHRRQRQGDRGLLHRQDDRHREAGALPHRRARGERLRVGAAAAQFEVVAASAGPRQLLRQGRPLPDGHRRLEHVGDGAGAVGHAALQLRRLRLAPLRAVVDVGQAQGAELPARLSHRGRRRLRHARHRLVHRRRQSHRGLRRADEAGDPRRVRHVDRPLRPRRDDPERAVVSARSIPR